MATELFANNASTTLASGASGVATTFTVTSSANFPAASTSSGTQFRAVLTVAGTVVEYVTVTNVSGTTWTVTRQSEDATRYPAGALSSGTTITQVVTAASLPLAGLQQRATATATTASIASGASTTATTMPLAIGYRLISLQTSRPARVRLYNTAAAQTADLNRGIGIDPGPNAGVVLDYRTTGSTTVLLSPLVDGVDTETTPVSNIPMTVTNFDSVTGTVVVTMVWIRSE